MDLKIAKGGWIDNVRPDVTTSKTPIFPATGISSYHMKNSYLTSFVYENKVRQKLINALNQNWKKAQNLYSSELSGDSINLKIIVLIHFPKFFTH